MHKNLREIQTKINDQLDEHSNKLKLNKEIKDKIETEINEITIEFTRCLIRQKAVLLKQTACVQNVLESNLNNLITKEKDLLARIKLTNSYDEIQNDLNELEALNTKLQLDFNYEFKKNTITKDNLNIGNLLEKSEKSQLVENENVQSQTLVEKRKRGRPKKPKQKVI